MEKEKKVDPKVKICCDELEERLGETVHVITLPVNGKLEFAIGKYEVAYCPWCSVELGFESAKGV